MVNELHVKDLKELIQREKVFAVREMLQGTKVFETTVVDVSKEVMDLEFLEAKFFEAGDVVGLIEENSISILGTVLDVEGDILTVYLYKPPSQEGGNKLRSSEGDRLRICEAEPLISYDLQLSLLESIENGSVKSNAVNLFFSHLRLEEFHEIIKLKDRLSVDGEFELDEYQCEAVEKILSLNDSELLLIIGPPGTGKTRVIQKAAYLLMSHGERVLITSHTNRAVDNAIEKLPVEKSLRVGRPEKVLPHLREYMLSYKARTRLGEKLKEIESEIEKLKKERLQILKHLSWLKKEKPPSTDFGASAKKRLKEVKRELGKLYAQRNQWLKEESEKLVSEVPIIGSTLVKSQLYPLANIYFDTILIDESSQVSVTLALLGMVKAKKWVLIGDHKQLLPIFRSPFLRRDNMLQEKLSAFTHLLSKYEGRSLWLRRHYRSNAEIIGFSSKYVYEGKITPAPKCYGLKLCYKKPPQLEVLKPEKPVIFIHCRGEAVSEEKSLCNEVEQNVCAEIVKLLLDAGIKPENIGVITPYRAQKRLLIQKLPINGLEINTIDAFQGREKDIIIFSLTATKRLDFASNPNRLNVAFTRPKYKLMVVGNGKSITTYGEKLLIYDFLRYVYERSSIYDWDKREWLV